MTPGKKTVSVAAFAAVAMLAVVVYMQYHSRTRASHETDSEPDWHNSDNDNVSLASPMQLDTPPAAAQDHAEPVLPRLVVEALALTEREALKRLKESAADVDVDGPWANPFADVLVTLPLSSELIEHSPGHSSLVKAVAAPNALRARGDKCIVYSLGVANQIAFEKYMQSLGCTVHAFDCTVIAAQSDWTFHFHSWCIGKERSFEGNVYSKEKEKTGLGFEFVSLAQAMARLGHTRLDVLKFDIEGFEWELFENEILRMPTALLPEQLLFELHTEGSNKKYVPPSVVANRTKASVNDLFLRLYDSGYRVVSVERNGDPRCAEFTLLRIVGGS